MAENFETWEELSPDMEKELKTVRRKLRRRSWTIVLTSVVLVAALLLATVKLIIPALEKQYWDPSQCTYLEDVTDLELIMSVYSELFGHGQHLMTIYPQKEGFADYNIDTLFSNWHSLRSLTQVSYRTASLVKGELNYSLDFWNSIELGSFIEAPPAYSKPLKDDNSRAKKYLQQLPNYVHVFATVTFPEDLTMNELLRLTAQARNGAQFTWAVLRDGELYNARCGVHLASSYDLQYSPESWSEKGYPNLFTERYTWSPTEMENHIKSMLKFSDDQLKKGQGILAPGEDPDYYAKTLSYMEQNGIKAYGSYVIATPQALLEMMEDGVVSYVQLTDARIGMPI